MVFSTHLFIFYFLPLVLLANYFLPFRALSSVLTVLSYIFYGWANPMWVLLMLFSSYVDYFCGLGLVKCSGLSLKGRELPILPADQPRSRGAKIALAASMCSNLGLLGFFKYERAKDAHSLLASRVHSLKTALLTPQPDWRHTWTRARSPPLLHSSPPGARACAVRRSRWLSGGR